MKIRVTFYKIFLLLASVFFLMSSRAQFLIEMIDTASSPDKGIWALHDKADFLLISGYFQPQFQVAQSKGARGYSGGDFAPNANNRFFLRRGRLRFDYANLTEDGLPRAQVVFQFDGTERGVQIRDFWGRLYENKWQLFSFTTGVFARPFGYEVNLSSSARESPERGRMSQILMKTERDLGLMATLEPRKITNPLRLIKIDVGIFNGQGLAGPEEFDSYKDIIGRVYLKPYKLSKKLQLGAGASILEGGVVQHSKYVYNSAGRNFKVDSSLSNIGGKAPRKYRGLDAQLKIDNSFGETELRAEYWWGTQTGTAEESATPGVVLDEPYYVRRFGGAFFYLLQNIVKEKHQVILKYDIYDPNVDVRSKEVGALGSNTGIGDIRFNTLGVGYICTFSKHVKVLAWYDMIRNEITSVNGFTVDVKDNVFTCRIQFTF